MDAAGDQQISEEMLQSIQSAVGSSTGVIGQVQVIETENGPMTVIFMEEGAESSDFSTQTAQQMGLMSGDDNVQYQFIQDGENYTTQVYEAGQESVLTTSTDSLLTGMDVTQQQITDQTQFAVSDTDTYYITETGEIVKIEGSLLDYGEGQQGFIQSNQAFETQTIMSDDASLVTRIPTVVSESTVVTSQTTIPDSSIISGVFEDQTVLPDTQTVLPDTTVHTGAQDNFEFTAVKVPAVQIQTASTFTSTGGKSLLSTGIKQPPIAFTNTVVQNPTGATRTVQVQRPGQQSTSYPKQSPIQSGGAFTSYINPTHLTQKIKTQPITYQIHSKPIQNTVTVKPKEVTIQTAYKPTTYQQSVQPSSVQTIISSPVITSNKSVNTQTKYSAKVSSTTLQPAVIKKIAVPPSQQIGTPAINRLVKVPAKQNKLNQISVTQQRDREVKHASDMLSNVIHAVDFNLPGAKSIPAASPILKPSVVTKATTSMASVPFATSAVRNTGPVTTSVSDLDMLSMVTQALNSGSLDQLTGSLDITNMARTAVQQTVTSHLETPLLNHMEKDTASMADTSTMDMDDLDSSLAMDTHQDVPSPTAISTTFKHTEQTVSGARANGADVEPPALPDSTGSEQASPSKTDVNDKVTASETASAIKPVTASSTVEKPKMKSIDVPDSDVTIELYADGTLVTKDRAGTNYSKVRLEDLGLDQAMLAGNTDIELLIVQGDGKEVRATINTNILNNKDTGASEKAKVVSDYKIPKESLTGNELRPYKCSMCPRTFKYYKTFRCHELVHTKAETYTCHLCKRVFARETNLASHLELHQKKAAMGIHSVKDKINRERRAKELLAKSVPKREWNCTECDSVFTEKSLLKEHVSKEHKSEFEKLCEFCDRKFHSEYSLHKHLMLHNGPFACTHCENKYEDRELFMKHMEADHLDKIFKCTICPIPKIILTRQFLEYHLDNRHEGESEETLKPMMDLLYVAECEICGLKFMKKSAHKEHMDMIHMEDRPEPCLFCEQSFMKKTQLQSHVKRVHNNLGLLECKKCGLNILGKDFANHQRIMHEGPYYCEHCKKTFDMRNDLEKHQFDEHDGGFSCKKCDVKFTYSHLLKSHLANHAPGSQTFLCEDCGEAFEIKPQYKSHLVSAHFKGNQTEMLKIHPEMKNVQNALTCYICGDFNFEFKPVFVKHIRDQHFGGDIEQAYRTFPWLKQNFPPPGEAPTCDTCNKQFQNAGGLKAHMRSHMPSKSAKKKKRWTQTDSDLTELDNDIETPEEEEDEEDVDLTNIEPRDSEKKYRCKKCDMGFSRQAALQKHINARHKKDEVKAAFRELEKEESERELMKSKDVVSEEPPNESEVSKSSKKSSKTNASKEKLTAPEKFDEHENDSVEEIDNESELADNPEAYDLKEKVCNLCNGQQFYSAYGVRRHMRNSHKILVEGSSPAISQSAAPSNKSAKKKTPASGKTKGKISSSIFGKKSTPTMMKGTETPLSDNSISVQADLDNTVDTDQSTDITAFLGRNFNLGKTVKETCNIESVKKKVHRCKECGEAFSREAALKKHLLEHETGEENDMFKQEMDADETDLQMANYACAECKNTYSTSLGLIHHNRIKHAGANEQELLAHIQGTDRLRKIAEDSAIVKTPVKSKKRKRSLQGSSNSQEQACKREKLDEKGLKMYECLYCPSSFKTFQAAMNHEKDSHPYKSANKPEIGCPTTPQYSKTGRLITKSRKLIERFNCPHCPKSFDLEKSLNSHITVQHFVKEEKDNALKSPTKQVQSKQGNVKLDGYKCQKCDKVFEQIINLRRHQMMKHKEKWDDTDVKLEAAESEIPTASGSMIYDCDVCKEKFSVLSAVQQHMKAVHDENDTPIVKSEMKSNKKRKLKATHLKTEGNGGGCGEDSGQIHRCAECYKSFKWKKNLSSHMRSFHSEANTKTKTCGICNKVFPNEHSIEEHMKTHDTTFDCAHCSKHFTSELSLKSHETQMHKNVRESLLVCNICTEKFTSKAKLLQHMLTHTSLMGKSTPDKPEPEKELRFSCKKCGKKFLNPWQIRLHNAKVHSMAAFSKVSKVRTIGNVKTRRQSADSISSVETRSKIKKAVLASKIKKAVAASKTTLLKKRKSTLTDVKIRKTGLPPKLSPKLSTAKTLPKSLGPPKLRLGPASYKAKFGASKQSPKPAASATLKMKLGPASYKAKFEASKQSPKPTASATLTPKIAKSAESKKDEPAASIPPVTCNICQKEFKKRRYLNKHMKNVHKVNKELNSMNVHKGNKELKSMKRVKCLYCRECHQMFWTMEQFEVHVKTQHPDRAALELDKQVMQRLVKTEMASPNRAGSLSALEDDDSGVPVQYKCEFCNTIMWTKQSFEDHIIKYHPDHVDEYGINEDVLTESKPQIELVDDRHDPTNFLNIELYNDITCDKLSTQPVVKIKKMTDTLTKSSVDVDPDVNDENLEEPYYSESKCPEITDGNEQHMETEEVLDVDINKSNEDKNENINDKMQGDVDEIQKRAMESESVDYLDYVRDKDNVDKSLASIGDKDDDTEGQTIEEVDHEKKFKEIQATGSASLGRSESEQITDVSYMVTEQHKPVADVTTNLHSTLLEQAYREPSNETEQHTPVVDSTTDLHNTSFEQACKAPSYETEQHTPVEDSTTDLRSTSLEQAFRKPSNETEQHTPVEDSTTDLHRTSLEQAYREPSNETEQHTSVEDSTTDLHSTSLEQAFSQPERGGLLQNTDSNELVPNKENYKYVQNMESNGYFFVEGSSSEGMFNVTSPSRNNVEGYKSTEEYIEQLKPSLESAASSNDIQSSPENIVMKNEDHLDLAENTSFSDQANDVSEIQLVNYKKMSSVTESIQRAEQAEPGQASTTDQLEEYVKYNNIAQQPDAISADNITKTQSFEESVEETVSSTHDWNTEEYLSNIKEVGYSTYALEDLGTNETAFAMQQVVSYADQDIVGNHVQFTSKTDAILGSEPMETE